MSGSVGMERRRTRSSRAAVGTGLREGTGTTMRAGSPELQRGQADKI